MGQKERPEKGPVLLVDDAADTRFAILCMLEMMGYTVDCAGTGSEAVEMTLATRYMAVLMDVEMPVMDGLAATKAIRERESAARDRSLRIIGITGHADRSMKVLCQRAGMDDYLPKPFVIAQLAEKLEAASGTR